MKSTRHQRFGNQSARKYPAEAKAEYWVWRGILQRCRDKNSKLYKDYGGRGIKVCHEWSTSFLIFLRDMGPRPSPDHEIERKDNEGDYTADNCCWATHQVNCRNRRSNRYITACGKTLLLVEWAESLGCKSSTILRRIKSGMTEAEAVTKPVRPMKSFTRKL